MNINIPSSHYLGLKMQSSLNDILNEFYNQINLIKSHPRYNSENTSFELEFRLRKKYTPMDVEDFINDKNFQFLEYLYKENKTTNYRIRCTSDYFSDYNLELLKEKENDKDSESNNINKDDNNNNNSNGNNNNDNNNTDDNDEKLKVDNSKLFNYLASITDMEISDTLKHTVEYTKKMTLNTAYYFIFKIALNIETSLDTSIIIDYLNHKEIESNILFHKIYKEISILQYFQPTIKKRRSFLVKKDIQIDVTFYDDKSQFEIDLSRNIYHERNDIIDIIHNIMLSVDYSKFILDYIFMLLPNFEFQKPITPSLDIIFKMAEKWIKDTFYVAAKSDGIRQLLLIINNLLFSISENFEIKFIDYTNYNTHLILDCEYVDESFIPFDILYNNTDLRNNSYAERINSLNFLNLNKIHNKIVKKNIECCKCYSDLQEFLASEIINNHDHRPNDGIVITEANSLYWENTKVYKIKTTNTVDIEFDGRFFYAKKHIIKKSLLKISLAEYKNICLLYNKHKKEVKLLKDKKNVYYRKKVDIVNDVPINKKVVYYQQVREKKFPFIIEFNLDTKKFVKVRKDKPTSNSINTFNSILLASFQKVNVDLFSEVSNILMKKYHNMVKQNILKNYKGKLLDIGSGNGGDIHKWKHFRKIVCVE